MRDQVWTGNRPEPLGPIAQVSFAAALRPEQRVRRWGGLRCSLRTGQDLLVLDLPDRSLTLPPATRPALEMLLGGVEVGGVEVAVGELPGLDDSERLALVRRLLREGALVPARAT